MTTATEAHVIKRESMTTAMKAINTLRFLLMPKSGFTWQSMFDMLDTIHESCHEASLRFVNGEGDEVVLIPAGEFAELLANVRTLRLETCEQHSNARPAVVCHFRRLEEALVN